MTKLVEIIRVKRLINFMPGFNESQRPETHREYRNSITELQGLLNQGLIPVKLVDEVSSAIKDGIYEMTHGGGKLSQGTAEKFDNLLRRVRDSE